MFNTMLNFMDRRKNDQQITDLSDRFDTLNTRFEAHEAEEKEKFTQMMTVAKQSAEGVRELTKGFEAMNVTITDLAEKQVIHMEQTKPVVTTYGSFLGAIAVGKGFQALIKYLLWIIVPIGTMYLAIVELISKYAGVVS